MYRTILAVLVCCTSAWAWRDAGLVGHRVFSTANLMRDVCCAATDSGVFLTHTRGDYWWQVYDYGHHPHLTAAVRFGSEMRDIYLAWGWGSRSDGLWYSGDSGASWSVLRYQLFANLVEVDPVYPGVVFTGSDTLDNGLWRSTDSGATWEQCDSGLPTSDIRALWLCEDERTVFAAPRGHGLYRSPDRGSTWVYTGPDSTQDVMDVHPFSDGWPSHLLLVGRGEGTSGVWFSNDTGATWTHELALENGTSVRFPFAGFLGDSGLYERRWMDSIWEPVDGEFRSRVIRTMSVDRWGGFGYVGTDDGVYHWDLTPGTDDGDRVPAAAARIPAATIARGVLWCQPTANGSRLTAGLVDIAGREVMKLEPGENDVGHLNPGVYFIREEGPRILPEDRQASHQGSEGSRVRKVVVTR